MKFTRNQLIALIGFGVTMAASGAASAQSAGQWTAKLGINKITPQVESGDISPPALPGSKGDVDADTKPIFVFGYGITDNISAELDLGVPYKHTVSGAGAVKGIGNIGTVEALPPTAFIQYRFFDPKATVRPFVGAGLTYAYFQKARGSGELTAITNIGTGAATTFKIDNKFAGTVQAGVAYNINERWFADVVFTKTWLKTDVHFSSGQYHWIKLDPQAVNVGIGYKF